MSADKRKVSTDALETLGTIIGEGEKRDAIHLAVEPMVAPEWLDPGEHVTATGHGCGVGEGVGIVDPFLTYRVRPGERFWLVIYPRQIHSLRHVWTHPAFPDEPEVAGMTPKLGADAKAASEAWLRNWCGTGDAPDYDTLLQVATTGRASVSEWCSWAMDGEYLLSLGSDASGVIPSEVWDHVETVTGKRVVGRPTYFACSC